VLGQLQERRAGGREFQILGDVTEKLWAPNVVIRMEQWADWYWMTLGNKQECENTEGNVNMQAVSNVKYWK